MCLMSRSAALLQAAIISMALTMLWLNWVQAIQAILLLFAVGSIALHLWLCVSSVLQRVKELPAEEPAVQQKEPLASPH